MWWLPMLALAGDVSRVHVDRTGRQVYLFDEAGRMVQQAAVGVGRGGTGTKTTMSDRITPTGTFTVDLVLTERGDRNAIAPHLRARWSSDATYGPFVDEPDGLARLYRNMSSLDFDGNGQPDQAYGVAYVGLDSAGAVTGPKMRMYRGTPYWYSIALHGTPDPANLGEARSGGCVHVGSELLLQLVDSGVLAVGQTVVIADGPPVSSLPD